MIVCANSGGTYTFSTASELAAVNSLHCVLPTHAHAAYASLADACTAPALAGVVTCDAGLTAVTGTGVTHIA